jgi:hypothetical protein
MLHPVRRVRILLRRRGIRQFEEGDAAAILHLKEHMRMGLERLRGGHAILHDHMCQLRIPLKSAGDSD